MEGADRPQSSQLVREAGSGVLALLSIPGQHLLNKAPGPEASPRGHVRVAVAEAQTFMAAPRFAVVLLILRVLALFSQTSGEKPGQQL